MDEQSLPIDIQLKKLLDWLISRRICNRQWHESIVQIREKIGHAIGDMPEHEKIKQLLSGTNINYFHCIQIVEILKETEKESKTFFGTYGSQRMKDWQEIVKLYQRENIYLAEAAQLLSQSVSFDIPGLKKQFSKSIQSQEDCDKKEKENLKRTKQFKAEFEKACKELGIEGKKIRKEIISLLDDLPKTYDDIAETVKGLKEPCEFYCKFLKTSLKQGGSDDHKVLSTLLYLADHGNVTTYEWMYGEPPLSVEEPQLQLEDEEEERTEQQDQIDFGDDIDFSAVEDVDLESGTEIDWGNLDVEGDGGGGSIDYGVDVEGLSTADIVIEDGGVEGGVARDSEALSLLDNKRTRTLILDEMTELQCFLQQRLMELESAEEGNFSLFTNISGENESKAFLTSNISKVEALISSLNTGKIHHLQLIRSAPKYVDRLVDGLRLKNTLLDKIEISNIVLKGRRDDAIQQQAMVQRKLDVLKEKTSELQKEIEQDVSKRYKNRPVNIMGGMQSV